MTLSPRHRPADARIHAGFTLVELLAVIAIMVLLLAFTVPVMRGAGQMNQIAAEISGILEHSRAYAMAQNTRVWVGFHQDTTKPNDPMTVYVIASTDGTNDPAPANLTWLRSGRYANVRLADISGDGYSPRTGNAADYTQLISQSTVAMGFTTALMPKLEPFKTARFLRYDPDGAVKLITSNAAQVEGTLARWVDVGLQRTRGGTPITGESALIQIAGLTGKSNIYQP